MTTPIDAVAFSPDGRWVASASGTQDTKAIDKKAGVAMVWDASTGMIRSIFRGHADSISGLAFDPDGRTVASSSWDRTIQLWDAADASVVRTLRGHTNCVESVAFRGDGRQLASGGEDGAVKLWDAETGPRVADLPRARRDRPVGSLYPRRPSRRLGQP